jgi:Ca-activated chloride channel family protein
MSFAQPGWFAALLIVPLLGVGAVLAARTRRQQWTQFTAARLRGALLKQGRALPAWLALGFLLLACIALIAALARPQAEAGTKTEKTIGRNLMIALDISRSMRVADVKPDRLTQAKVVIYELLEAMPNDRIGFIGFAGTANAFAPLTIDHSAVRETVEQVDENWAPLGGSDLAAAVHLATDTLRKTGQKSNALVILSDGEKHDDNLESMIAEAERSGVYIIAVAVGTDAGDFVPNPKSPTGRLMDNSGHPVISRMHPEVMRQLAEGTKGRFAIAGSGMDIPALVKSVVQDLDAFEMDGRERKISVEFYQWLMFPAVVFLMIAIVVSSRWRAVQLALLTAGMFLIPSPTEASEASRAKEALSANRNEVARDAYRKLADQSKSRETQARFRLGEAIANYRAGDFRAARTAFSKALLSRDAEIEASGHRGMGNSLFQLGWKGIAGEAYPTSEEAIPNLDHFDGLVKDQLAKLLESDAPEDGDSSGYRNFEALITNWADAVRHYESALNIDPADKLARKNRELTVIYLKRLQELLQQEEQETEQSMPQPQPGEGQPQQGEGGDNPQQGEGGENPDPGDSGNQGEQNQQPREGDGKEGDRDAKGQGDKDEKEADDPGGDNPNESPEQRARRILKENADLEKGPLSPGRREFRDAEKDW